MCMCVHVRMLAFLHKADKGSDQGAFAVLVMMAKGRICTNKALLFAWIARGAFAGLVMMADDAQLA